MTEFALALSLCDNIFFARTHLLPVGRATSKCWLLQNILYIMSDAVGSKTQVLSVVLQVEEITLGASAAMLCKGHL